MKGIKRILRKKTKTGASLLVVIISVTLLIVMGSTFSIIAMSAYNNSHRRLCQQQAYYTAEACLNILSSQFASDPTGKYMNDIRTKIIAKYNEDPSYYANVSDAVVTIANLEDKDGNDGVTKIPTNNFEASLLGIVGGCRITASAVEGTKNIDSISQIRLRSTGTYKGFSQTVSARMATTTNGALELKKIFSNSQSWNTPIVTLIAGETTGDMYFSSPGKYERWPNGEIKINDANEKLRNDIYGNVASGNTQNTAKVHTRPFGIDNKPLKLPSTRCIPASVYYGVYNHVYDYNYNSGLVWEYRDKMRPPVLNAAKQEVDAYVRTNVLPKLEAAEPSSDMEYANYYYKAEDYGKFLGPNGATIRVRTRGIDKVFGGTDYKPIDTEGDGWLTYTRSDTFKAKYPQFDKDVENTQWYNDWVEIYMFTGNDYVSDPSDPNHIKGDTNYKNIVDGDMYVNTQALIGLYDKDQMQVKYWPYRDVVSNRDKVERKYVSYLTDGRFDDNVPFYRDLYRNGYSMGNNFEHGGNSDLFFDYSGKTTVNGQLVKPPKYYKSILSHNGNMYLFEDARIECYDSTHTPNANKGVKNNIFAHKNLVIDGIAIDDSLSEGSTVGEDVINYKKNNLFTERNVSIYGDVMVEGNLMISNATIYGDVYVNGNELYIADSEIYGNVYFNGTIMTTDNAKIRGDEKTMLKKYDSKAKEWVLDTTSQGTLIDSRTGKTMVADADGIQRFSFQTDSGKCVKLNGGDLVVLGKRNGNDLPKDDILAYNNETEITKTGGFAAQEARFYEERTNRQKWGIRLTNTSIHGTLFSEINTSINAMFKSINDYKDADGLFKYRTGETGATVIDGNLCQDTYNDIVVNANLLFDLQEKYRKDLTYGNQSYMIALANNAITVKGVCMAQRMQIVQTQAGDDKAFLGKFSPFEVEYVQDPQSRFADKVKIEGYDIHKEYSSGYMADRGVNTWGTEHYRCSNVQIKKLCVGDGGCFIDGSEWYYQWWAGIYNKWYAETKGANTHTGIIIEEIYCTSDLIGQYKWNNGTVDTVSKMALYNLAGKPSSSTEYNKCKVYAPIPNNTPYRTGSDNSNGYKTSNVTMTNTAISTIRTNIYNDIFDLIEDDIAGRVEKAKAATRPARGSDLKNMDAIMGVLREYYMTEKAPHRINSYYKHMSDSMNYRGYKDILDIREWHNSNDGRGPYQAYDPEATDGVWRQIKLLKWGAPTSILPYVVPASTATESPTVFIGNKQAININSLAPKENYIKKEGDDTIVISGNIKTDLPLYIPAGYRLVFDSTNGNIHAQIGGLILQDAVTAGAVEKNAQVILRGGNMTFLYLSNKTHTLNQPKSVSNMILYMGNKSKIGAVEGSQSIDKANDSIYLISSDDISYLLMRHAASINGYVYAPNGYLEVAEYENKTTTDGKHTHTIYKGTNNTIVRGSMIVKSFLINMDQFGYDEIYEMYKNLKYEYIMAPLICDTNIQYGDTSQEIIDYGKINWGFIGFD